MWGYLFKASLVKENKIAFIQSLKYSEDSNFIFKCLSKSKCIYLLDEQVYNYNVRENSAIRQNFTIEWAESNFVALIDFLKFQHGISTAFQKKAVHYYLEAYFSMLVRVGNYNRRHIYNNYLTFCCEMNTYLENSSLLRNPSIVSFEVLKLIYSSVFFSYRLKVRLASLYKRMKEEELDNFDVESNTQVLENSSNVISKNVSEYYNMDAFPADTLDNRYSQHSYWKIIKERTNNYNDLIAEFTLDPNSHNNGVSSYNNS